MKKYLVPVLLTAIGVIAAGVAIKWGNENDIPLLKEAAEGFDS